MNRARDMPASISLMIAGAVAVAGLKTKSNKRLRISIIHRSLVKKRNMADVVSMCHSVATKSNLAFSYPIVQPIFVLCFVKSMFWKIMSLR